MQILIITCWQGHISINWIGDGIQNCCNYCNFPTNCRVGGEYFTSNKWKTVFHLKLVYSIGDVLFYISGAFCWRGGLCSAALPARFCAPVLLLTCTLCSQAAAPALGWGSKPAEILLSLFWLPCYPFCLFIDHTIDALPARERLARSSPAGKVIFIWSPLFSHAQTQPVLCMLGRGCVCVCQIQSSHINMETKMRLARTPCVVLRCENAIHQ